MRIFKHHDIIQHMKGGVGGKAGWMELCVTHFTTVDIVFKRGGVGRIICSRFKGAVSDYL